MSEVGLKEDVFIVDKPYQMFSGQAEAAKFIYRKIVDSNGKVWLYPVNSDSPAEQVHFFDPEDKKSDGYGGSTLHFTLEDGTVFPAKGPWHSSASSMLYATGIDITNTHWTYGCVALKRRYEYKDKNYYHSVQYYEGILHADKEPVLGQFDRLKNIAQSWADKLGHPVVCYSQSKGGSSSGFEIPTGTKHKDWTNWFKESK